MHHRALVLSLLATSPALAFADAPAPYTSPLQLRGAVAGTSLKSDTVVSSGDDGTTVVSFLGGAMKVMPDVAVSFRFGLSSMSPTSDVGSLALMNPQVGVLWSPKVSADFRVSPYFAVTLPFGMGGGDDPDHGVSMSLSGAKQARMALDSSIASPNHLGLAEGISGAWIAHGFTLQADLTLLQSIKTRGPDSVDELVVNATGGLFLGYSILPQLSVGSEVRYQRFVTTPSSVVNNPAARDQASFALGARGAFKLDAITVKPGVSFARALGGVIGDKDVSSVTFDLGVSF